MSEPKPLWEIEPHYCSDYDVLVVDDEDAWDQLIQVVEHVYDNMVAGDERTITIRFNGPRQGKETSAVHKVEFVGDFELCANCPPVDYPTNETRCNECPRLNRMSAHD